MNPNIERLKLIFIAVFALAVVGVVTWQVGWIMPMKKCEVEKHGWWDPDQRICARPVLVTTLTHRPAADKQAEAAARAAIAH
jgi:hypothetical protein